MYGIRSDTKEVRDSVASSADKRPGIPAMTAALDGCIEGATAYMEDSSRRLQMMNILIDRLPEADANRQELSKVKAELVAERSRSYSVHSSPHDGYICHEFAEALNPLVADTGNLEHHVLDDAEETRRRNETKSRYAWWISAALFSLGWGLGLVGKLYGVPEVGSGE
jgi:hypothetical protein